MAPVVRCGMALVSFLLTDVAAQTPEAEQVVSADGCFLDQCEEESQAFVLLQTKARIAKKAGELPSESSNGELRVPQASIDSPPRPTSPSGRIAKHLWEGGFKHRGARPSSTSLLQTNELPGESTNGELGIPQGSIVNPPSPIAPSLLQTKAGSLLDPTTVPKHQPSWIPTSPPESLLQTKAMISKKAGELPGENTNGELGVPQASIDSPPRPTSPSGRIAKHWEGAAANIAERARNSVVDDGHLNKQPLSTRGRLAQHLTTLAHKAAAGAYSLMQVDYTFDNAARATRSQSRYKRIAEKLSKLTSGSSK